ncbi:MAG: toprim domain-containing protein [Acidobacteria bacterium]|nr:toprim domain-containing protein [Acidobacteriota bacterium]
MPRIPENELERLKAEVDLVELVRGAGVELKPRGKDLVGLCPFHPEKEASFVVSPDKNLFHCLGCGAGGSVVDWVMKTQGVSFRHAVELLREGQAGAGSLRPVKRSTVRRLPPPVELDAEDHELLLQVADFYHRTLKDSAEALGYLKRRGLDDGEAIDRFKLGYANRTLGLRLPNNQRKAGREIRGRLVKLGIFRGSGHEHLAGSLTIPVFDVEGRVGELYGRKIQTALRKGTPKHLYISGQHRGVWNLDAFRASKEIILCESLIDALTLWCAGYRHVTASFGTNGFTEEHMEALKAYGIERVLIAYDRDEPGEAAAWELAEKLGAEGISCFRVLFPKGMDANEYACHVTPPAKSLGLLLRSAQHVAGPTTTAVQVSEPGLSSLAAEEGAAKGEDWGPAPLAPSSPEPPAPKPVVPAEVRDNEIVITLGDRRWRVRGLGRNMSFEQLRVNVLVSLAGAEAFHVDTFDLYSAKHRASFVKQTAAELGVKEGIVKKDLGRVLLKLEELQEEQIRAALEPKEKTVAIGDREREEALELLKDPKLLSRVVADLEACGLVGEETNKLTAYLATTSRKLAEPLAVLIQSSSAAGKSALMNAVLEMMPAEERVAYSAMTGQSLFYMGEADLKHKVLAIAEEEGAERASYALKLLQSEGELSIASTGKDPHTGKLVTQEYRVEGPVAIMLTTTAIDLDEELLNRCVVLSVDEGREQTRAIHELQRRRRTPEGLVAWRRREKLLKLHQNAQRLLRPLPVGNPYAARLTFLDAKTRTRRDHAKYLTLIEAVTLLHQHQRPIRRIAGRDGEAVEYVEVTPEDIELANRLAAEVLGRSLDELPPQTRRLLELIHEMVSAECERRQIDQADFRFSRREVREHTGWGNTQLKIHFQEEMEYLVVHRGGPGQRFAYELLWTGQGRNGESFLLGLIDPIKLERYGSDGDRSGSGANRSGSKLDRSAPGRPPVGGVSGGGRGEETAAKGKGPNDFPSLAADSAENALLGGKKTALSYGDVRRSRRALPLAAAGGAADEEKRL